MIAIYIYEKRTFYYTILALIKSNFFCDYQLCILTSDGDIISEFKKLNISVQPLPKPLTDTNTRLTLIGFVELIKLKQRFSKSNYDLLLQHDDWLPTSNILAQCIPTFIIQTYTDCFDANIIIEHQKSLIARRNNKFFQLLNSIMVKLNFDNMQGVTTSPLRLRDYLIKILLLKRSGRRFGLGPSVKAFVIGERFKVEFIKLGVSKSKLQVAGIPHTLFKREDKNSEEKICLFFLPPLSSLDISELKAVRKAFELNFPIHCMKFVAHPRDDKALISQVLQEFHPIQGGNDLENVEMIEKADFLVQKYSTMGFVSIALNKPIFSYSLSKRHTYDTMFSTYNPTDYHAASFEELYEKVSKFKNMLYSNQLREEYFEIWRHKVSCFQTNVLSDQIRAQLNNR